MQPNARERLTESRLIGGDPQIARERQVHAGAGRGTIDGGECRKRQRIEAQDDRAAGVEQRLQFREPGVALLELDHVFHVAPRAERAPGAGDHEHAD